MINEATTKKIVKALTAGKVAEVEKLLKQHPEYITHDFGMGTLLFDAVTDGNCPMVEMMARLGFDVNYKYQFGKGGRAGKTPLGTAVLRENPEMVQCLLKLGADPAVDADNQTLPLNAAVGTTKNTLAILKHLHAFGCDLNQVFCDDDDDEPVNALSMAMTYRKTDVVQWLKSIGCTLPEGLAEPS